MNLTNAISAILIDTRLIFIILLIILFFIVFGLIILAILTKKKNQLQGKSSIYLSYQELFINLGKIENIKSATITGSRTKFILNDLTLVNFDALKIQFNNGIFVTGNALTIICGFDTKELVERINTK